MRALIITNDWKGGNGGGIMTYLLNLVGELNKRENLKVKVIFRDGNDSNNYEVGGNNILFMIKAFLILEKMKPELILSQGNWYCLFPGYVYKKLHDVKLIHTFHSEPLYELPFFMKFFIQCLLNGCDYCTFVSKGLQNKIEKLWRFKFKKTAITYACVKQGKVYKYEIENFKDKFDLDEKSLVLLVQAFTANPLKAEGVKLVLKSLKTLQNKYPNIVLIITRDGSYSKELKDFAKSIGVSNNVIFTGDVDNAYVPLAICDIFIHPWLGGGNVSLALLESMSMGKPIIATHLGGISEAIVDGVNGILVHPDENQIVEKIEYLLKNKKLATKLGENAKYTSAVKFNCKSCADVFLKLN